jgi:hypothetical protein
MSGRSLAPLEKTLGFGMTPLDCSDETKIFNHRGHGVARGKPFGLV